MQLPVDILKPEVLRALGGKRPLVVTAPTGSGKSTRLPLWLAEQFGARVLVVEPRRIACRSLATFLSSQHGAPVGTDIGYRVRFDDCSRSDTRILFVTPGVALRMLHNCTDIPFSAVMLDEFHERGWETDLLLAALREHLSRGCRVPLVITSATIESASLATTLGAACLEASGRLFPVHVSYCEDDPIPSPDRLEDRVAKAVRNALRDDQDQGDILVFLPGMREIDACSSALRGDAARHDCEMIRVHGSLPTDKTARALSASSAKRRIFLATNVAETSLTLPNVTVVVDSGLARTRMHRAGRSSLVLTSIARSSMDQRAGRAGRVAPGRCVRLWSSRFQPQATTPPEVLRIELDDVLLNAAAMGVPLKSEGKSHWITPPPEFAVSSAVERLRMLGALDDHDDISPFGRRLLALPVSVHEARLLVDVPRRLLGALCDLVARLQTRGPFFLSDTGGAQRERDERDAERQRLLEGCSDEVMADLRCIRGGVPGVHGLYRTALENARRLSSSLRCLLKASESDPVRDRTALPPPSELASFLLTRWSEAGFVLRQRAQGKGHRKGGRGRGRPWGNGEVELLVTPHPLWKQEGENQNAPVAGLILDHEWLGTKGTSVQGIGRLLLPCTYTQMAQAGLGETIVDPPRVERKGHGRVRIVANVRHVHAGVTLSVEEKPLTGAALRSCVAGLILAGRLLGQAGERLLDELHLTAILREWPDAGLGRRSGSSSLHTKDAPAFLAEALERLGVETQEDLQLLDEEDILPDLAGEYGLSPAQLAEFRKDLPRQWTFQGAVYICEVNTRARTVLLTPANKAAAKTPPQAWTLPPFRSFSVKYRKASRTVTLR